MRKPLSIIALSAMLTAALPAVAEPRADLLAGYAAAASKDQPGFAGFSAERGRQFHVRQFAGGKADAPACASCHGENPRTSGRTRAGKAIEPMAVSVTADRYTDGAKVEKWFRRNCNEVLGRECTAQEKGDWLTYMSSQ